MEAQKLDKLEDERRENERKKILDAAKRKVTENFDMIKSLRTQQLLVDVIQVLRIFGISYLINS